MRRIDRDRENFFRYFRHDANDEAWQLYATTIGRVKVESGAEYPYRQEDHPAVYTLDWATGRILNEFQFLYIAEGSGRFRSFEGERLLFPGSLAVLVPGERHWYRPDPESGWKEYWIGFKGECADRWLERGFILRNNPIHRPGYPEGFLDLFEEAVRVAQDDPPHVQRLIAAQVPRILAALESAESRGGLDCTAGDLVSQARAIFEEHLFTSFEVDVITSRLNVAYQTLRDQFHQQTGMSPYQYFLQMKINKAKELLLRGDMSVKEISFKLAFDNPYYFSRLFKKKTGVSPTQWSGKAIKEDLYLWDD